MAGDRRPRLAAVVWPSSAGAAEPDRFRDAAPTSSRRDSVTVDVGDTVTWNNTGGFHNVVFDDGSFTQPTPPSFEQLVGLAQLPTPGTFRYYCQIHGGPNGLGMSGTVTVNAGGLDAKPLRTPLAIAYKPCPEASANRKHADPLGHPACSPPVPVSDYLTVGTADSNQRHTTRSDRSSVPPGDPARSPTRRTSASPRRSPTCARRPGSATTEASFR